MNDEQFMKKITQLFGMYVNALKNKDMKLQKTIIKMEQKLLTQYQLSD